MVDPERVFVKLNIKHIEWHGNLLTVASQMDFAFAIVVTILRAATPNHLWLGTSQENTADMVKKGRSAHNRAEEKLTESEVLIIREMSGTNDEIAKMFGVSRRAINAVRNYESWRHLSDTP